MEDLDTRATQVTKRIASDEAHDTYSADATPHELRIAVDHSRTGIAWLTAEGVFSEVRAGYARMLGYTAEELTGKLWAITVADDDQPACRFRLLARGPSHHQRS